MADGLVKALADYMVEEGRNSTTQGNYIFDFSDLAIKLYEDFRYAGEFPAETWLQMHCDEIVDAIDGHEEVIPETWLDCDVYGYPEAFDINFGLAYCPNADIEEEEDMMYTYDEFKPVITEAIKKALPEGWAIEIRTVAKAEGERDAIVFTIDDNNAGVVMYLDELYGGSSLLPLNDIVDACLERVAKAYGKCPKVNDITSETVFNHLTYRLVNKDVSAELLRQCPHFDIAGSDIAVCAEAVIPDGEGGEFRALVRNGLLEDVDNDENKLWDIVKFTAPKIDAPVLTPLGMRAIGLDTNVIGEDPDDLPDSMKKEPMVLSNESGIRGAGVIWQTKDNFSEQSEGVLGMVYNIIGSFYAVPSSVNEWILVPATDNDPNYLKETLHSANETVVDRNELLSNELFMYDGESFFVVR